MLLLILFFSLSICGAEKDLPKPIIRPREVIIYPPTTVAEFMKRREILREVMLSTGIKNIVLKDEDPKSDN